MYTVEEIIGNKNLAVHCVYLENANKLIREIHAINKSIKWSKSHFERYKNCTCYSVHDNMIVTSSIDFLRRVGQTIVRFNEIDFEKRPEIVHKIEKYTIEQILCSNEDVIIHCDKKYKAKKFIRVIDRLEKYCWGNNHDVLSSLLPFNFFDKFKKETCYYLNKTTHIISVDSLHNNKLKNKQIFDFDKIIFPKYKFEEVVQTRFSKDSRPYEFAIHCTTREQIEKVFKFSDKYGKKWSNGKPFIESDGTFETNFRFYKGEFCLCVNKGLKGKVSSFKTLGFFVIDFEDIIFEDKIDKKQEIIDVNVNNELCVNANTKYSFKGVFNALRTVFHCKTEEQANFLLDEAYKLGLTWPCQPKNTKNNRFDSFKEKTCYWFNSAGIGYDSIGYCSNARYTIIEFEDLVFEQKKLPENKGFVILSEKVGVLKNTEEISGSNRIKEIKYLSEDKKETLIFTNDDSNIGKTLKINEYSYPESFYKNISMKFDFSVVQPGALFEVVMKNGINQCCYFSRCTGSKTFIAYNTKVREGKLVFSLSDKSYEIFTDSVSSITMF